MYSDQKIDNCQYIVYAHPMTARARPASCCTLRPVERLPDMELNRVATLAKALADPNRIEMLRLVARQAGPVCACDIVDRFDLTQPTVSHHLKILKEAGLLRGTRNGLWAFYEIDADGLDSLRDLTESLDGEEAT